MKNLFNNQFGFSLIQGMIVASVVAGSGLVATRLITDQKLAQKGAETRDQIEELHNAAYAALQNRDNCKVTFNSNAAAITATSTGTTSFPLTEIKAVNGVEPVIQVHGGDINKTYLNGNVLVESMNVTYDAASGKANLDIMYERLNKSDVNKRTKTGYGAKSIKKSITLRVQKNPFGGATKPFESCYGINTGKASTMESGTANDINKDLCQQMNINTDGSISAGQKFFVWNEATSTCLPNAKCPDHQVYTGVNSNGVVLCKDIGDVVDFGTMVQPTPMSDTCGTGKNVYFEASADGKTVRIRCQ